MTYTWAGVTYLSHSAAITDAVKSYLTDRHKHMTPAMIALEMAERHWVPGQVAEVIEHMRAQEPE